MKYVYTFILNRHDDIDLIHYNDYFCDVCQESKHFYSGVMSDSGRWRPLIGKFTVSLPILSCVKLLFGCHSVHLRMFHNQYIINFSIIEIRNAYIIFRFSINFLKTIF